MALVRYAAAGIAIVIALALCTARIASAAERPPFGSMYSDASVFLDAIAREQPSNRADLRVTGISVPHHLLAADLMARGFWTAAGNSYERVIILAPDHYSRSRRPMATTQRGFDTVFGRLENDETATAALLEASDLFDDSDLFDNEHGIAALLPFIKHFFPAAKAVPVAMSYGTTRADWDRAFAAIAKLVGPRVLVVQSTDYSHYLPLNVAVARDQETLNIIAANDLDAVAGLVQPAHLDTKAAQYVQMRLQGEIYQSAATVIANRNSAAYSNLGDKTTSYIVTVYTQTPAIGATLRYADQEVVYFAGDTYLGRFLTAPLADADVADAVVKKVKSITGGAPLIVNLEGAMLDEPPEGLRNDVHVMHAGLAIPLLTRLNVKAAGLANNHSFDLGPLGIQDTQAILERSGITPVRHEDVADLGAFRLIALNFIGKVDQRGYPVVQGGDLENICRVKARGPLIALVHWGQEYTRIAGPTEYAAAEAMQACGVSAIIGAHSHQAGARIESMAGGEYQMTYSLGNFLFDQRSDRSSSALLELRIFRQGTFATRLIPTPNLFELATAALQTKRALDLKSPGTILERSK